ncbi:hypothetical protein PS862_04528 [Pseudomonas fluorescens]|uniref:Uncharacterized protein n=1 Tax=Pseudomonas fluorescens TaxID=294 RepID=A0A5E7NC77_PSEFL|nr:hypothetical protein [Pseudomonas fluorescens]VVP34120.1 hypothetical protein PS862_04528 [Pseudomonas fluorescens]
MTLILMRWASDFDMSKKRENFRVLYAAHPDALIVSGCSRCYNADLDLVASLGLEVLRLEEELYDPQVVFGVRKAHWLLDEHALLDGRHSLVCVYHQFSLLLQTLREAYPNRPLVLYFDQLMLELALAFLTGQGLSLLKVFSLYLEEHSLAIMGRAAFGSGFQWVLLKSNVKPGEAFHIKPQLTLVT